MEPPRLGAWKKKVDLGEKHKDTSESSCGENLTSIIHSQNEIWYKEWVLMTAEESFKKKKKILAESNTWRSPSPNAFSTQG